MKTCSKCGQVMADDDDFCMSCGARVTDKPRCEACGETVRDDDDFCVNCGARIVKEERPSGINFFIQDTASAEESVNNEKTSTKRIHEEKSSSAVKEIHVKIYSLLHYVPVILLSLFTVLLFLFFLAPNGWSNIYMIDDLIAIFYLAFGAMALVYTAVAVRCVFAKNKPRIISVFGLFSAPLGEVLAVASCVVYITFIILSSIDIGGYTWLGEALPSTASELILAFAVIFMFLEFAAIATRVALAKKFPSLVPEKNKTDNSRVEAYLPTDETPLKSEAPTLEKNSGIMPDNDEEYTPDKLPKSIYEEGKRPLMYYMVTNKRLSRANNLGYVVFFLTVLGLIACWILHTSGTITLVSPHWIVIIGTIFTLFFALMGYASPVKNATAEKLRFAVMRRHEIDMLKFPIWRLVVLLTTIVAWFLAMIIVDIAYYDIFLRGYIVAMIVCVIATLSYVACANAVAKRNAAMAIYLWGWMSPTIDTPFIVDYDEERERAAYEEYLRTSTFIRTMNEDDSTERRIRSRRIAVGVMTALFVAATTVACPVSQIITDKFSANYAMRSVLPKEIRSETLSRLYGDFNFIRLQDNCCIVEYYSDNWLELYKEYYDLSKQLENESSSVSASVISRMEGIQLKMATLEYKYLGIYVDCYHNHDGTEHEYSYLKGGNNWVYGRAVGIVLDTARGGMSSLIPKQAKETNFDVPTLWQKQNSVDLSATFEIWYSDGSYMWQKFNMPKLDTSQIGVQTFTITDAWGGIHNVDVSVVSRVGK